jgi:hypothetical protein
VKTQFEKGKSNDEVRASTEARREPITEARRSKAREAGSDPEVTRIFRQNRMPSKRPRLEQLFRIDIHRTVTDGYWVRTIGGYKICLNPERHRNFDVLTLDVNNVRAPQRWILSTRRIAGRLRRGGKIPWDKSEVWYVHGSNNRRYRFLYVNPVTFEIGTRTDHRAQYTYNCLSDKQRIQHRKQKRMRKGQ